MNMLCLGLVINRDVGVKKKTRHDNKQLPCTRGIRECYTGFDEYDAAFSLIESIASGRSKDDVLIYVPTQL